MAEPLSVWRRPFVGYLITLPLVALVLALAPLVWNPGFPISSTHINTILLLLVTVAAAIWGIGPSLCLLLVGTGLILDLFFQPLLFGRLFPHLALQRLSLNELISIALFALTGTMISIIVYQRERARRHAQEQENISKNAQHQLEEFIGIICHELKTPLTGIQGNIQFACRKIQKHLLSVPETVHLHPQIKSLLKTLHYAERSAVIETRLVDDLLDASRIQRNMFRIKRTNCNLIDCVDQAVERLEGMNARKRIVWDRSSDMLLVYGDPDRLEQIVSNYLSNALKYARASTLVVIHLTTDADFARVSVSDEGPGLSLEEQQRIWERFYRAQSCGEPNEDDEVPHVGLGIGLSLCRAIAEQHGGQVGVESIPGEGSTFWFTVPLNNNEKEEASQN
ncbi:sensor histidine kinase [Dictyobacter aurantiacus]|uniref:histidine kinase n=1 Tax=Dictyobacter aurantiacus TaxID=1936993 RepID=A0A401ZSP2_9CHLR|nr:HAMP domain-containing sensor histidine kinase [Dictyobacter aurantiacus]GCE09887.1 hypothetical protein KDAU_72160 [Dictyobacter aurantiacus]